MDESKNQTVVGKSWTRAMSTKKNASRKYHATTSHKQQQGQRPQKFEIYHYSTDSIVLDGERGGDSNYIYLFALIITFYAAERKRILLISDARQ